MLNSENSFIACANGMKTILDAFIKYSDFKTESENTYFEDIEDVTENVVYLTSKLWIEETIEVPWFK